MKQAPLLKKQRSNKNPNTVEDRQKKAEKKCRKAKTIKRIRLIVENITADFLYGYDAEKAKAPTLLKIDYLSNNTFLSLKEQCRKGTQLNLLSSTERDGILYPAHIIYEPDFLIDVSTLSAQIKSYGISPLSYIITKLSAHESTAPIMLGGAANRFMDDCLNHYREVGDEAKERELFFQSMRSDFSDYALSYLASTEITKKFFEEAEKQFENIHSSVWNLFPSPSVGLQRGHAMVEPSFICEALGLRGRMDVLSANCLCLVELKSGKADERNRENPRPREEHCIQTALYKEILYYNLGCAPSKIKAFLFYSRYPSFFDDKVTKNQMSEVMALRNAIVYNEYKLKETGIRPFLPMLTVENINERGLSGRFFDNYLRKPLDHVINTLNEADQVEMDYFDTFFRFTEREQFLSKIGDKKSCTSRGFSNVWNKSEEEKLLSGDILFGKLSIAPCEMAVETIYLCISDTPTEALPNFRQGEMVQIYNYKKKGDNVTNKQVFRAIIEKWTENYVVLRLAFKQPQTSIFSVGEIYAMEHDFTDSSFSQAYRGLFSFLKAPQHRRDILLGRCLPERESNIKLCKNHVNAEISEIVEKAKQARDLFLLTGPPGTGKTSIAIRSMTEEFLLSYPENESILLLAYTNRAVDELCSMIESIKSENIEYLRIGSENACAVQFRDRLIERALGNCSNRKAAADKLMSVRVIVSTIAGLCGKLDLFRLKRFKTAIVDEASQVLETQLLPLLSSQSNGMESISKFILVGDERQLPAVVMQTQEESKVENINLNDAGITSCSLSLFERLKNLLRMRNATKDFTSLLRYQGRMHTDICDFVCHTFYEGKIAPVPLPHQIEKTPFPIHCGKWERYVATTRLGFLPVQPANSSNSSPKANAEEADTVCNLTKTLIELYEKNGMPFSSEKSIGIIVPFRAQIESVRLALRKAEIRGTDDITIDTVECFQGSQRDIIIFSTTISQPYQKEILSSVSLTGKDDTDRKLNVAITRARKQVFIVGNPLLLSDMPQYLAYIKAAKEPEA